MSILDTVLLGVVQGLTEFLPVSSSGHLVLCRNLLGFREPDLLLDVTLHLGTLCAVIVHFFPDIKAIGTEVRRDPPIGPRGAMFRMAAIGTIPAAVLGVAASSWIENAFGSARLVGLCLMCTGVILVLPVVLSRWVRKSQARMRSAPGSVDSGAAWWIGLSQAMAILPGISRSGSTISVGLLCGLDRETAGRFAFLLSIPIILGAALHQVLTTTGPLGVAPGTLLAGFLASAVTGYIALRLVMRLVRTGGLFFFAPYCWLIGTLALLFG